MKCVILAAGKGVRMMPLTKDIPKPLIKINNKPFLHYVLKNLLKIGIKENEITIIVNYKKVMIEDWLKKNHSQISAIDQKEPKGTGHAVSVAENFVGQDNFLMVNADDLYDPEEMKKLLDTDKQEPDICYGIGYPNNDVTKYAAMITDEDGFLVNIIEKPNLDDMPDDQREQIKNALSNPNLWKFTPEVFDALRKIKLSPRGEYEITDAAQLLADERKMKIIPATGYWEKLGCPEDIKKMEHFLKNK